MDMDWRNGIIGGLLVMEVNLALKRMELDFWIGCSRVKRSMDRNN